MLERNPTICIIEDNLEARELYRRYLLQDVEYHYQIFEEETGKGGLTLCKTIQPNCILLDYNLPDIDGLEFLAELGGESSSVPYAVIMLTGLGSEAVALQAMKSGAQDYLVKDEMTAGNLFRAIHNAIERTSMRRALEKHQRDLEEKNQEIQAFAYALAHDLRAPLRAITSFSQIIAQDYDALLDDDGKHYMGNIVRACFQMDRLIEELLHYRRMEHRTMRAKPTALEYLFTQLIADMEMRITQTQAIITIAQDLPVVYGDPTLMQQIFANLLNNALTYTRPGVQCAITVTWREDGHFVVIGLQDNGIGIAAKHWYTALCR
jgi:signal transduction histidine kinase